MKILVINCGSSSLKYQLLDMTDESVLAKGLVERIGIEGSVLKHERTGMDDKFVQETPMKDHKDAIGNVMNALVMDEYGVVNSMDEIGAVGHRVVHAGEKYASSVVLTDEVIKALEECVIFAPLHNPPNLMGIAASQELMPNTPNVAVFDTAFHQTMEPSSYIYGLPYEFYEKHGVRRYGFHGTSHKFVSEKAAAMLGKKPEEVNIVTCHLGNGASVAAVKGGVSVNTSMGFTPLEGLVMGTRSGDIDPAIVGIISEQEGITGSEVINILNKKSGVMGISGVSSDFRDLGSAAAEGNKRAELALEVFAHKVKFYIGAYMAEMNGADAIVFTAGIGENDIDMRARICSDLDNMGIKLDLAKNDVRGEETIISADDSKVKVFLIPTNEELVIARDTYGLTK